jgi:DNA repair photolyase
MGIRSVEVKSVLQKSGLPGTPYVVNPYIGCVHGCVYCYARFMKRFSAHSEPWGTFLDVKANAPPILKKQLVSRRKPLEDAVFFSSVTDPYQPPEKEHRLTRNLLEILLGHQIPASILTKSDLVVRDADLLRRMPGASAGCSFSTPDDSLARILEPRASAPSRRAGALQELRAGGIDTWAFLSPFLPGVSDLDATVAALEGAVGEFAVEAINLRGGNWGGVEKALTGIDPALAQRCKTLAADAAFWKELERKARRLADRYGMKMTGFYRH